MLPAMSVSAGGESRF